MNKNIFLIAGTIIITSILTSCSIQKRVYNSGFHIEWFGSKNDKGVVQTKAKKEASSTEITLRNIPDSENSIAEIELEKSFQDNESLMFPKENENTIGNNLDTSSCDIIINNNGDEIYAKVTEISLYEIKYKNCDNLEGPTITISKKDVFMIKYPNGTKTIISQGKKTVKTEQTSTPPAERNSNDRSLMVTILLWLFLGVMGIHRFYIGHYVVGILYLLTGAFCGIGWLIDGILLLTGGLKPRNGDYYDDF